jgi:hypothetical protein
MDSRVFTLSLLTAGLLVSAPGLARAQPWADALRTRQYEKAADLLHVIVMDNDFSTRGDPAPAEQLAVMYAGGLGVPRDRVLACALAQFAEGASMMRAYDVQTYLAVTRRMEKQREEHCGPLSNEERLTASRSISCFAFGLQDQTFEIGGQRIHVGKGGVGIEGRDQSGAASPICAHQVAHVRTTTIAPPANAAPGVTARYFVELFWWGRLGQRRPGERPLEWQIYEVLGNALVPLDLVSDLYASQDEWARPGLPPEVESGLTLEMVRSGHVLWRLAGSPPRRGWFLLPDETEKHR